jgi:hypothetical protein
VLFRYIPLLAAAAFEVATDPRRARRWPVIAVPTGLYGAWYVAYGASEPITQDNILATPAYVAEAAAAAVGAIFGLGAEWGRSLALALAALVAWRALTVIARPWRLAALVGLAIVFWALTGLARAGYNEPDAPRYIYPGVVFVLLVMAEAGAGLRPSRRALVLVALLLAGITISNVGALRNAGGWLRDRQATIQGGLAASEIVGPSVPPNFLPAPTDSPQITTGEYRALREELPAPPADLPGAPPFARTAADAALLRLARIELRPGRGLRGVPPATPGPGVTVRGDGGCLRATGSGDLTVPVPTAGLDVSAERGDVAVAVQRFADAPAALGSVGQGETRAVVALPDASAVPWRARLTLAGEANVCGV